MPRRHGPATCACAALLALAWMAVSSVAALDIAPLLPPTVDDTPPAPPIQPTLPEPAAPTPPPRDPDEVILEKLNGVLFEIFVPPPPADADNDADADAPSTTDANANAEAGAKAAGIGRAAAGDDKPTPSGQAPPINARSFDRPPPATSPARSSAPAPAAAASPVSSPPSPPPPPAADVVGIDNRVSALAKALEDPSSPLSVAARDALDNPLTWGRLEALVSAATDAARAHGWSLARAFTPAQNIGSGVLRIEVIPVTLEDVDVEGARWSKPEKLRRPFAGVIGRIVNVDEFAKPGASVNQHPFRRVTPSLAPGLAPGTTRLKLKVDDARPVRVFAGFDTTHSRTSGMGRYSVGFMAAAPWRMDDIVTLQYSFDSELDHLNSASLSYRSTLPWGHTLTFTGLAASSDTDPSEHINQRTGDYLLGFVYGISLPSPRGWSQDLGIGFEWRRSTADYKFGNLKYFDNVVDVAPFSLNYQVRRADKRGQSSLFLETSVGAGDWLGGRMDKNTYQKQRLGTDASWAVFRWDLRRDWILPRGFLLSQHLRGQVADGRLPEAPRYFLGGTRSVRGYRESELSGDGGVCLGAELTSPAWAPSPLPAAERKGADRFEARLAAFWDWGQIWNEGKLEFGEERRRTISGAGLGLRLSCGEQFFARVEYAKRLHKTGVRADDVDGYWHASVNVSF